LPFWIFIAFRFLAEDGHSRVHLACIEQQGAGSKVSSRKRGFAFFVGCLGHELGTLNVQGSIDRQPALQMASEYGNLRRLWQFFCIIQEHHEQRFSSFPDPD
jgi:hypothetical protein